MGLRKHTSRHRRQLIWKCAIDRKGKRVMGDAAGFAYLPWQAANCSAWPYRKKKEKKIFQPSARIGLDRRYGGASML